MTIDSVEFHTCTRDLPNLVLQASLMLRVQQYHTVAVFRIEPPRPRRAFSRVLEQFVEQERHIHVVPLQFLSHSFVPMN